MRTLLSIFVVGGLAVSAVVGAPPTLQPAAGDPLPDLTAAELARFDQGAIDFDHTFTPAEGLGPIHNDNSCGSCHSTPLGGTGTIQVRRAGVVDKINGFDPLADQGGSLFQLAFTDPACEEVVPMGAIITFRSTPGLIGYGLVETIPDADIQFLADNPAAGLSGRTHLVGAVEDPPMTPLRVGRFGWKSVEATVLSFTAGAAFEEIGITNRFHLTENDPNGIDPPTLGVECIDLAPDPEDNLPVGSAFIDTTTDFQRFLAAPPQTPKSGMAGETIFMNIGCGDCHTPSFTTGTAPEAALTNKVVKPYADFLLHKMGLLADSIENGDALGNEFRTTPLMGLCLRGSFIHDGRVMGGLFADNMVDVISEHDSLNSESAASAQAFAALSQTDKDYVIAFLGSLGRREFDVNCDNIIDVFDENGDFLAGDGIAACITGSVATYSPDDHCSIFDVDQDGDVDDVDVALFVSVFSGGTLTDCNNNSTPDIEEIAADPSVDSNNNGVLDTCEQVCGNGMILGTEGCDDGALVGGDGCSDTCAIESGWSCSGAPSVCSEICGDGQLVGGETCDDGGTVGGDGCSAGCSIELGWSCSGAPSSCGEICGDGLIVGAEECDDGNTVDGDGCSATCTITGVPTISTWGLVVLALLLLTAAKVLRPRRASAA